MTFRQDTRLQDTQLQDLCQRDTQAARIADLVAAILAKYPEAGPLAPEADLARSGMTSIDMVELMLAVEAEFDVTIPPPEITLENFRSVAAVDGMVTKLLAKTGRGSAAA